MVLVYTWSFSMYPKVDLPLRTIKVRIVLDSLSVISFKFFMWDGIDDNIWSLWWCAGETDEFKVKSSLPDRGWEHMYYTYYCLVYCQSL